jgi:hypothetical protein
MPVLVPTCNSKPSAARTHRRSAKSSVSKCTFGRGELAPEALDRVAAFRLGAAGHNHLTPGARQFQYRMPANPAVCSGRNLEFSGLGWNIRDSPWRSVDLVVDIFDF